MELGENERAVESLSRAIECAPDRAGAFACRGYLYLRKRQPRQAAEDFSTALRLDPSMPCYYLRARAFRLAGNAGRAKLDVEGGLGCATAGPNVRQECADELAALGEPDRALRVYDDLIQQSGPTAGLLCGRGRVRLGKDDLIGAERDCTRALEIDPDHAASLECRAQIRYRAGHLSGAIADLTQAIRHTRFEWSAYLYYARAWVHKQRADGRSEIADLNTVLAIDPQHLHARVLRGEAFYHEGNLDRARDDLGAAARQAPRNALVEYHLGVLDSLAGDPRSALLHLTTADELGYDRPFTCMERAGAYQQLGRYRSALRELETAASDGTAATPAIRSGVLYKQALLLAGCPDARVRDPGRAVRCAEEAYCLGDPTSPHLADGLALCLAAAGRWDEAAGWLDHALELARSDPRYRGTWTWLYLHRECCRTRIAPVGTWAKAEPASAEGIDRLEVEFDWCDEHDLAGVAERARRIAGEAPQSPSAAYFLGLVLRSQGDEVGAVEQFTRCLEIDPDYFPARVDRARVRLERGDRAGARADATAVLARIPDHTAAREVLDRADAVPESVAKR